MLDQLSSRNCFFPSNDVLPPTAQNMHLIPPTVEALKPLKISLNMRMQRKKLGPYCHCAMVNKLKSPSCPAGSQQFMSLNWKDK